MSGADTAIDEGLWRMSMFDSTTCGASSVFSPIGSWLKSTFGSLGVAFSNHFPFSHRRNEHSPFAARRLLDATEYLGWYLLPSGMIKLLTTL